MEVRVAKYEVASEGVLLAVAERMPANRPGWFVTIYLKGNGGTMSKELVEDIPHDEIVERLGWVAERVRDLESIAGNLP